MKRTGWLLCSISGNFQSLRRMNDNDVATIVLEQRRSEVQFLSWLRLRTSSLSTAIMNIDKGDVYQVFDSWKIAWNAPVWLNICSKLQ